MVRKEEIRMSKCLSGEYEHKLDAKGRVIIPQKLREELGLSFMVTKGIDNCLYIYGMSEWEEFVEKLNKLPMTNRTARAFKRGFLAGAVKCEPDSQGRILLSQKQREYAGIDKQVYVIGNGEKAEIWSKEEWDGMLNAEDNQASMDELAEQLDELDFRF